MTATETRRYEMLVRVLDFGEAHGDRFPASSRAREQFAVVRAAVQAFSEHAVTRMSARREGRTAKAHARAALLNRLQAMGRTARAIAQDTPGMEDTFHLPHPKTDQVLLTAGRLFTRNAEAFTSQFVEHAMPETFLADLKAALKTFEAAIHIREAGKGDHAAARASIAVALRAASASVKKLDAMVTNHFHDDPVTTALWRALRHIGLPHRSRRAAETRVTVADAAQTTV